MARILVVYGTTEGHTAKVAGAISETLHGTGATVDVRAADDPVYMKGKYSGQDVIEVADAPYAPDHCKEQGFIDYSKQVSK